MKNFPNHDKWQTNRVKKDAAFYNQDGNPSSCGNVRYTYDTLDRLIAIEDGPKKLQFTYDSYHRRLTKTVTIPEDACAKTTRFLYDGLNEIGSIDPAGTLQELRILGLTTQAEIGSAIALEMHGTLYTPIHDIHCNIATLISLGDSPHETFRYTAFGEELAPHPTHNPWRFSSKRTDKETGLVYFGRKLFHLLCSKSTFVSFKHNIILSY